MGRDEAALGVMRKNLYRLAEDFDERLT
jgi:hypothetical protein